MKKVLKMAYDYRDFIYIGFATIWYVKVKFTQWGISGSPWINVNNPSSLLLSWPLHKFVFLMAILLFIFSFKITLKRRNKRVEERNKEINRLRSKIDENFNRLEVAWLLSKEGYKMSVEDLRTQDDENMLDDIDPLNAKEEHIPNKYIYYLFLYILLAIVTPLIWIFLQ